jgi:hypothetical protein
MAALAVKSSARFKAITPALLRILQGVFLVAQRTTDVSELVITSVNDSEHMDGSRHYSNEALDLRVRNLPSDLARQRLQAQLRAELGPAFTVLYEHAGTPNQHLHIQVKRGTIYAGPV